MYRIRFTIQLPGQADPHPMELTSDEPSWRELISTGDEVVLPPEIFTPASAVPDEWLGVWDGEAVRLVERRVDAAALDGKPVVLLVVESPHVSEYAPGFKPIAPLQGRSTRRRLRDHLPAHLRAMGVPAGAVVVACNPVQWQASLGSLRPGKSPGEIRTIVWKALFEAGWEADFRRRVAAYHPGWILNACTTAVKAEVDAALPPGVPVFAASHPSSLWFEKRTATRVR